MVNPRDFKELAELEISLPRVFLSPGNPTGLDRFGIEILQASERHRTTSANMNAGALRWATAGSIISLRDSCG